MYPSLSEDMLASDVADHGTAREEARRAQDDSLDEGKEGLGQRGVEGLYFTLDC